MSASPPTASAPSQKRPLEEPSSPSAPTDQPDAKRPALDKVAKSEETEEGDVGTSLNQTTDVTTSDGDVTKSTDGPSVAASNGAQDSDGDTHVPDAPSAAAPGAADILSGAVALVETHPIQSTSGSNDRGSNNSAHGPHQDESAWIHLRAVISSAEAATVIGKGGENVTQIRRLSGAKCTVSDYSRGAVERILTVSGLVDAAAKVWAVVPSFSLMRFAHSIPVGIRSHHSDPEQRATRDSVECAVEDVPSPAPDSTHSDWIDHWKVRRTDSGDPRCVGRASERV